MVSGNEKLHFLCIYNVSQTLCVQDLETVMKVEVINDIIFTLISLH